MAAFKKSNICWCNFQPNSYRDIEKKMQNYCPLNAKNEFKLSCPQSSRDLLVEIKPKKPQVGDKDVYEICCRRRKRKPEYIQEVKKFTGRESRSILPELKSHSYDKPTFIAQRSLTFAQGPAIVKREKPKWHEEHEKKLKERANEQDLEKQKILMQNLTNKREGLDKFQRHFDFNKTQNVRRYLQWEQKKDSPYRTSTGNTSRTVKPENIKDQKLDKQNMMKKREGLDQFQRLFDFNKAQNVRRNLQWKQKKDSPYQTSSKTVKPEAKLEKENEQKLDKQNMIKKREGLDKFQRLFDFNKAQYVRRNLQWEQQKNRQSSKDRSVSRPSHKIPVVKESQASLLKRKKKPPGDPPQKNSIRNSNFDQISVQSGIRKIKLKKFYHYIKNSKPDQKIWSKMNSKDPISYLKSDKSFFYHKSFSQTSSDKNLHISRSVISTTNISNSTHGKMRESKEEEVPRDTDAYLFDTNLEENYAQSGKIGESQALSFQNLRDEVRQNFLKEERAAVQARIQELMKEVAIREDYRPPKPPKNFVMENILRLQNIRVTKTPHVVEKINHRGKFPTLRETLTVPEDSVNLSRLSQGVYNTQPLRIRRYSDKLGKSQLDNKQPEVKETPMADNAKKKRTRISSRKQRPKGVEVNSVLITINCEEGNVKRGYCAQQNA
ncbi:uncharacterized protein LOC121467698 [Drosophila elegans]|uniref:uncharacterized protein LOC121467698 n=1 Tax=Drosophila elegans TaxID=30023 RepID=UPI001BC86AA2|nr:uncharacterized protein LOC121467698 [Drosophila elegans]